MRIFIVILSAISSKPATPTGNRVSLYIAHTHVGTVLACCRCACGYFEMEQQSKQMEMNVFHLIIRILPFIVSFAPFTPNVRFCFVFLFVATDQLLMMKYEKPFFRIKKEKEQKREITEKM